MEAASEIMAREALSLAGIESSAALVEHHGWSNRVWLSHDAVVRISSGRFPGAFAHEAGLLRILPPGVPHAELLGHGEFNNQREWIVLKRIPGQPLPVRWPVLDESGRRSLTHRWAKALAQMHQVSVPADFAPEWWRRALTSDPPAAYHAPPSVATMLLEAARTLADADLALIDDVAAFIGERERHFSDDEHVLVHADLHGYNILVSEDGDLAGFLDFEGARAAPADLELDTILRWCARAEEFPAYPGKESPVTAADLRGIPGWLAEGYPTLFSVPGLRARLQVYEGLSQLVQVQHPGWFAKTAWRRLRLLVEERSHLDDPSIRSLMLT